MDGLAASKLPWRKRLRPHWLQKHSATDEDTGTAVPSKPKTIRIVAAHPLESSATTHTQSKSDLEQAGTRSTGLPALQTSPAAQLLSNALKHLDDRDRVTIEQYLPANSDDVQVALDVALNAAQRQRKKCLDERWSVDIGKSTVVLHEQADKVIRWIDRFKSVGDVVANVDPIHVGLPWAGIRLLLEIAVTDANQMAALVSGCEISLYMANRLKVYVEFWQSLPSAVSKINLEESIVLMYAHILQFLALAMATYDKSTFLRLICALWNVNELTAFEEKAKSLITSVQRDADACTLSAGIQSQIIVMRLKQKMDTVTANLQSYHDLQASINQLNMKITLDKIPFVNGAIFNSYDGVHSLCHPATRKDLLLQAQNWARQEDGKSIFWLHGPAGSGKSTVSWTMAQWLSDQSGLDGVDLGASFFFKRGEGDRGSAKWFFPTLIRQLATKLYRLDEALANVIESDGLIFGAALPEQFRRLFLQPLDNLSTNKNQAILVVVVDALDECENHTDIGTIIELWSQLPQKLSKKLRLFLTSRYQPSIYPVFQEMPDHIFRGIDLVDAVPLVTIQQDLSVYINDSFTVIRKNYERRLEGVVSLEKDWIDTESLKQLVDLSVPLFIVAATICRFVGDPKFDPRKRLERIMQRRNVGQMAQMELTYGSVLEYLHEDDEDMSLEELCRDFRIVVGAIIVLAEPLSSSSLATLLNVPLHFIREQLAPLQSVLRLPTDPDTPVRTLHLSFAEFLTSSKALKHPYGIDPSDTHLSLATHCLRILSGEDGLCENICDLDHPGYLRQDIDSTTLKLRLPTVLQYAALYWARHMVESRQPISDDSGVHHFLVQHFLHWLEALSLMNRIIEATGLIELLLTILQPDSPKLSGFLQDAKRFILSNRNMIDKTPLQLYSSAIIFATKDSPVRMSYGTIKPNIRQHPTGLDHWTSELQRLEFKSGGLSNILFSPDGKLIASGDGYWGDLQLWDVSTGRESQTLVGHRLGVKSVAFSPDGTVLASGADDRTIRLWRTRTGQKYQILEGHTGGITAIAYTPDGSLLVSGSTDGTVRVWDLTTNEELQVLKHHSSDILAFAVSSAGSVASTSCDSTIAVFDPRSGRHKQTISTDDHYTFSAISFLQDHILASGSSNGLIELWDIHSGTLTGRMVGHEKEVVSLSFSKPFNLLASGSKDWTVRVWNAETLQQLRVISDHSDRITSVAFAPDSMLLTSSSTDGTIRIWNDPTKPVSQPLHNRSTPITALAFSSGGSIVVSGSEHGTITIWNPQTAKSMKTLPSDRSSGISGIVIYDSGILAAAHSDGAIQLYDVKKDQPIRVISREFKMNNLMALSHHELLATNLSDQSLQIWNARTGKEIRKLKTPSSVRVLAFSPDGFLACGCHDRTVRLWNVQNGREIHKFEGPTDPVNLVTFSPDNTLIAAVDREVTVCLWDRRTNQLLHTLNDVPIARTFQFTSDSTGLIMLDQIWHIDPASVQGTRKVRVDERNGVTYSDAWIRIHNRNQLYIPHAYRGICIIHKDKIAIGTRSGEVIFFEFDTS